MFFIDYVGVYDITTEHKHEINRTWCGSAPAMLETANEFSKRYQLIVGGIENSDGSIVITT